ncbi:MAG TPA: acyl carrier protein [Longimicrobiales bacterium]|nr:acyl carrier protein [Longimicrobiales bacterium]
MTAHEDRNRERVRRVLATTLQLSPADLPPHADADSVQGWDSLGHLEIIDALCEEFGVDIDFAVAVRLFGEDAIVAWLDAEGTS